MDIVSALRKHEQYLLSLPNVTGVGIGEKEGKEVILVFVRRKIPRSDLAPRNVVPKTLDGYETDVQAEIHVGGKR